MSEALPNNTVGPRADRCSLARRDNFRFRPIDSSQILFGNSPAARTDQRENSNRVEQIFFHGKGLNDREVVEGREDTLFDFEDGFDFDSHVGRQCRRPDRAASTNASLVAEDFAEQFAAAVDHSRLGIKTFSAADKSQ